MPNPGLEVGSKVIQAWLEGRQLRQRMDEFNSIQAQRQAEMGQQQAQFQERQKLEQDRLKQQADIEKQQLAFSKSQLDQQRAIQTMNQALAKAQLMQGDITRFSKSTEAFPREQVDLLTTGGGPQVGIPRETFAPYSNLEGLEDIIYQGQDVPLVGSENAKLAEDRAFRQLLMGQQIEGRQKVAETYADVRKAQIEAMKQMGMKRLDSMKASLSMKTREMPPAVFNAVIRAANDVDKGDSYKSWLITANAYNRAQDVMNSALNPGVRDMTLVYQYLRTQDNSTVREGEQKAIERYATSGAKKLENFAARQVMENGYLSDSTRKEILRQMKVQYESQTRAVGAKVLGGYRDAQLAKPDLTIEDFMQHTHLGAAQALSILDPDFDPGNSIDEMTKLMVKVPGIKTKGPQTSVTPASKPDVSTYKVVR